MKEQKENKKEGKKNRKQVCLEEIKQKVEEEFKDHNWDCNLEVFEKAGALLFKANKGKHSITATRINTILDVDRRLRLNNVGCDEGWGLYVLFRVDDLRELVK